jgi:uncharacterized membrane protein (UPF0127 family)
MTMLLAVLLALACTKTQPADPATALPVASTQAASAPAAPALPHVVFPDNYSVLVEVAADDDTRQQGLMYRDRLQDGAGMIFLFAKPGDYPFWMKNTLIPLDLIWIDEGHRIVHVAHDVPPCKADPCPNVPPNATASSVLEVAAGVAAKHHLAEGQTLRFEGLDHIIVR